MNTYRYKSWSGGTHTVDAASVEFTPTHVVFRDVAGLVVLAERAENVNQLSNVAAVGTATRRIRD